MDETYFSDPVTFDWTEKRTCPRCKHYVYRGEPMRIRYSYINGGADAEPLCKACADTIEPEVQWMPSEALRERDSAIALMQGFTPYKQPTE